MYMRVTNELNIKDTKYIYIFITYKSCSLDPNPLKIWKRHSNERH